jgi:hypothetical protein
MRSQEHRQRLIPILGMSSQVGNGYQGDNFAIAPRRSKRPPLDGISGNMRAGGANLSFGSNVGLKGAYLRSALFRGLANIQERQSAGEGGILTIGLSKNVENKVIHPM